MNVAAPINFHSDLSTHSKQRLKTMPPNDGPLVDQFGRHKTRLRISLTDRCNLRCPYCMPDDPTFDASPFQSFDQWQQLTRLFVRLGITQIRLTGGEPTLLKNLHEYLAALNSLRGDGLERISLTSNGILLPERISSLKAAGLDDINISLDALNSDTFQQLSGNRSSVDQVIAGIDAAVAADVPVKINAVIIRGINEQEILPLLNWCMDRNLPLRFIEFMPLDGHAYWSAKKVVSENEILDHISDHYAVHRQRTSDQPATYYQIQQKNGEEWQFGVIPTVSNAFCGDCNRLRLTAKHELFTCLFSKSGQRLSNDTGSLDEANIEQKIRLAVWNKGAGFMSNPVGAEHPVAMHRLGG